MRQLFRKEYAKELEDFEMALAAQPDANRSAFGGDTLEVARTQTMPPMSEPTDDGPAVYVSSGTPAPPEDDKPRGFWGSLFKRKK
jgi:hypothetical protein